jgi:hypothetical protein
MARHILPEHDKQKGKGGERENVFYLVQTKTKCTTVRERKRGDDEKNKSKANPIKRRGFKKNFIANRSSKCDGKTINVRQMRIFI